MPAVLLECGFMDSTTDTPIILTEDYADKVATACVEVLAEKGGLTLKKVEDTISAEDYTIADVIYSNTKKTIYIINISYISLKKRINKYIFPTITLFILTITITVVTVIVIKILFVVLFNQTVFISVHICMCFW